MTDTTKPASIPIIYMNLLLNAPRDNKLHMITRRNMGILQNQVKIKTTNAKHMIKTKTRIGPTKPANARSMTNVVEKALATVAKIQNQMVVTGTINKTKK